MKTFQFRGFSRWLSCVLPACLLALGNLPADAQQDFFPPPLPVVLVVASTPNAAEAGPIAGAFSVGRIGDTNRSLTVFYRLHGTAQNGVDYAALPGSVVIEAGHFRATIPVTPLPDAVLEPTEQVELELILPPLDASGGATSSPYWIGFPARAVVSIADAGGPPATNHPPMVALFAPGEDARFSAGATITLAAQARDEDGSVTKVEFFAGTRLLGAGLPGVGLPGGGTITPVPNAAADFVSAFSFVWANVPEGEYSVTAVATDNEGASRQSPPVRIVVTAEIPTPVVSVVATDPEAAEGPIDLLPLDGVLGRPVFLNTGTFTIRRNGGTNESLTVFYRLDGAAENGVDYAALPGEVTIPPGAWSADVVVTPLPDGIVEGPETVELNLTPPPFPTFGTPGIAPFRAPYFIGEPARALVTIADHDVAPPTNHPPSVVLHSPAADAVFVAPANILLMAAAWDVDGTVATVEFFAGTNSLGFATNNPLVMSPTAAAGSALPLSPFSLVWTNVPRGEYTLTARATDNEGVVGVSAPRRVRVAGENIQPMVVVMATRQETAEGPRAGTTGDPTGGSATGQRSTVPGPGGVLPPIEPPYPAAFTFRRTGGTNLPLTVYYSLSGTASNGVDYAALPGAVTIPAGQWTATVPVVPLDDNLVEPTESVILTLEPPACIQVFPPPEGCYYLIGRNARAVVHIYDNDFIVTNRPPNVRLINPTEGSVLSAGASITLIADAHDEDGLVNTVEFFAGTNSLGVVTNQPLVLAPVHPFSLVWSNVVPGTYALAVRATDDRGAVAESRPVRVTVLATNAAPTIRLEAIDRYAVEKTTNYGMFRVFRRGDTSADLVVRYAISGSASNGEDYAALPGAVTIPAGADTADIEIIPLDDDLTEGIETVTLSLLPPDGVNGVVRENARYQGGPHLCATVFIFDHQPEPQRPPPVPGGTVRGDVAQPGWRLDHPRADRNNGSLTVNGENDQMIVIEVANDLHEWSYLTHGFVIDGKLTFTDPDRTAVGTRFYRVATP